jgi:ABC-type Fe3+/spermidine/putrescine transport system ATPase subunit
MTESPTADQQPAVSIRSVRKTFGEVTALADVSLDIRRGEFFSLLGPSGCGKTTLLRIIGGFESPDQGEVFIAGRNVEADPPYRRRTNMIFQHLALFPHLTVAENIAFGLEMKRKPRPEIDRMVSETLDLVQLGGYGKRKIDELSGGQKQRIAIARALVNEPEVLLLDEPLGALDLQLRLQMHDELKRIHRSIGGTFILVTHDQGEAITLSDRIAVMDRGQIVQLGSPHDIYAHPRNRFVARFIGHANFIEGEVVEASGEICVLRVGEQLLRGRSPQPIAPGRKATGVLRYEALRPVALEETAGLPGVLDDVTFMGSSYRLTSTLVNGLKLIAELPAGAHTQLRAAGEHVRMVWDEASLTILAD